MVKKKRFSAAKKRPMRLEVRLSKSEKAAIEDAANKAEMSLMAWLRRAARLAIRRADRPSASRSEET